MFSLPYPLVFSLFFLFIVIHCTRNKFRFGLSKIPGPPLAAFTRLWRFIDVCRGQTHLTELNLHRKYGKIVRVAPDKVSISDPAAIPIIYNLKENFTKSGFYPLQEAVYEKKFQPNVFSTRDPQINRDFKRATGHEHTLNFILKMENRFDDCASLLFLRLQAEIDTGKPIDLGKWLQYYAFDVVGEVVFGKQLGFLESDQDVNGILKTIQGILFYSATVGQIPEAHRLLLGNPLLPIIFPNLERWNQVTKFALDAIISKAEFSESGDLKLKEGQAGADMLSHWIGGLGKRNITTKSIIVPSSSIVFAGSDTTAIAFKSVFYHLIKNPRTMKKLVEEIDEADRDGKLSTPITHKESIEELPYLQAVIQEAMRIHPSTGLMLERCVPAGGAKICGVDLAEGTIVGMNPWVTHFNPEVFEDPTIFKPERWLTGDKESLARMEKSIMIFGAGSRICMGRHLSLIELRKLVPELLRRYEISIDDGKEWRVRNVWFVVQEMPFCTLKQRVML